jgi:hypothetical protein
MRQIKIVINIQSIHSSSLFSFLIYMNIEWSFFDFFFCFNYEFTIFRSTIFEIYFISPLCDCQSWVKLKEKMFYELEPDDLYNKLLEYDILSLCQIKLT